MKLVTSQAFLVLLALSPVAVVQAEETQSAVIVTATRTAQTADATIAPVIVIDREEIANNPAADVSDLLRMHAGIDIGRNGGPGQQTSVFIRGAESNHTLVMIDGVKINPGTIGTAAIQNIRLDMIERIEIVKGPRSTLYGSEAIGGVINIITRRGKEGSHYEINAGYGSFDTRTIGFNAHNKADTRAAGITVNAKQSDGYTIRSTSAIERGYDNLNLHLYGKRRLGETDAQISYWHSSGTTEYLDFLLNPVDQDYTNSALSISFDNSFTTSWLSKLKLSRIVDEIDQNQSADFAHTQRDVLDWQHDVQISDDQLLTAGIYLSQEHTQASVFGSSFDQTIDVNAVFVQDDLRFGDHHLLMGLRHTDHETYGTHNTGSIDYAWHITDAWQLMVGVASGFRSPDSTDLFGGTSANPNLLPEESENKELGLKYTISKQQQIRINYFNNDITNLIEYDFGSSQMQNIAEAQVRGTELEYQFTGTNWLVKASAISQDPQNKADGAQLSRRSKQSYSLAVDYRQSDYQLGLDILHSGERDNSAYDSLILDAYTLVNFNAHYQATKRLSLNGRIENLTDETYELAATYRPPERSYYLELLYNFD